MSTNRLQDLLNLANVLHWHPVATLRKPTVAEHSFRVAAITMELCQYLNGKQLPSRIVIELVALRWALCHDGPEVETGDVPHPAKRLLPPRVWHNLETEMCPWYRTAMYNTYPMELTVVKIADLMECYLFIDSWGHGEEAMEAGKHIYKQLRATMSAARAEFKWELDDVVDGILVDAGYPSDTRHSLRPDPELEGEVKSDGGNLNPSSADASAV